MKTTRVGGGHPGYRTIEDPGADGAARASYMQDPWHYTVARMVDACTSAGILPYYGPVRRHQGRGGLRDAVPRRLPAGLRRHLDPAPVQIDIAKRVFSPDPEEVRFAKKVIEAIPTAAAST
jgi:malyl-CoA/(S)-citramalyl-CoA lyase